MKNRMLQMSVRKKVEYVLRMILVSFGACVLVALIALFITGQSMTTFYNEPYVNSTLQMEARKNMQMVAKQLLWATNATDSTAEQERIDSANEYAALVAENIQGLNESFKDETLLASLNSAFEAMKTERSKIIELLESGDKEGAVSVYESDYAQRLNEMQDALIAVGDKADANAQREYKNSQIIKWAVIVVVVLVVAIALSITIRLGKMLSIMILNPVNEIEEAAKQMSDGNLRIELHHQSADEFGSLADSMRSMASQTNKIIEDISVTLTAMSEGDFTVESSSKESYIGDYTEILEAMYRIRDNLNGTMLSIDESSIQVAQGATQMAMSAQELAEGATEQAGAIEELTATVADISHSAEESATNADRAYVDVMEASDRALERSGEVKNLTEAMDRISDTSKEIENIIAAIEDIASQTNLLSLNASIEAARAGEAGKGFAVVADQIGKLASDSAQSAVTTKELISKSLMEIENGNQITLRTAEAFREMIETMTSLGELAKGSSVASKTQAEMLKQVEGGIEQISSVVQSNSAAAEETSASSEELSAQSDALKNMVSNFTLNH